MNFPDNNVPTKNIANNACSLIDPFFINSLKATAKPNSPYFNPKPNSVDHINSNPNLSSSINMKRIVIY